MSQLRDEEEGCEWDKAQNFQSIAPYTIEEAYEVADAIDRNNIPDLIDELGDLLLQVVFLSQIAKEEKLFSFEDVVESISDKLIRRHPYVFSQKREHSLEDQTDQWEEIKNKERSKKNQKGVLSGIAKNLPALKRSQKIQKRASKAGFDWRDVTGVFNKIKEEIGELEEAINENHQESIKEEIGDLFMIMTNLAQKLNVDSEDALISANKKFINRFAYIETALENEGTGFSEASFEQLDSLWEDSKKLS